MAGSKNPRNLSCVEALEARQLLAFTALINFQPSGAPTPSGYKADTGAVFGDRGNGFSYGWNAANNNAIDRNSNKSPDQRYDTFAQMQIGGSFTWELAVPAGNYAVNLISGDPSSNNAFYHVFAEGQQVIRGAPSNAQRWLGGNIPVSVTDGRLTITSGISASNNKINFIEVTQVIAPTAPSNLIGTGNVTLATVSWQDNSNNEDKFVIQKLGYNNVWQNVKEVAANTTTATVYAGSAQTNQYRVLARSNTNGDSAPSDVLSVDTAPQPPVYSSATPVNSSAIDIAWDSLDNCQFHLEKLINGQWVRIAPDLLALSYRDSGLTPGTTHSYRVISAAANSAGESAPSDVVTATTAPAAVTGLMATGVTTTSVSLRWDDTSGEAGYLIERSTNGTNWTTVTLTYSNITSYTNTGLQSDTNYFFRVTGFSNGVILGDRSDPILVRTLGGSGSPFESNQSRNPGMMLLE